MEGMSDEDWEHAQLASEVENAKRETNDAETRQIQQESHWAGVVGFVKEVVIRIFLFNTVRLLLTIALLGGDAAMCVYASVTLAPSPGSVSSSSSTSPSLTLHLVHRELQ